MSVKIRVLSDHLVNQIAAGEVVEDAASAAKELIENALDAGASRVVVHLEKGGYQLLSVVDDGCGMSADDAVLCFERHATSKIRQADDLVKIHTLGFRGEALAALAAVSKIRLTTALRETENKESHGMQIEIAAGRILRATPYGRTPGTTIEIRELFYNVAARRKFQPSPITSEKAIMRLITAFALGYPHVDFLLYADGKNVFQIKRERDQGLDAIKSRVENVLGDDLFVMQQPVDAHENGYCIQGFLGAPRHHRAQRSGQYLFVEGRYVYSSVISRCVREAFSTRLPEGRHPLFVLFLQFPRGEVDVNVHPQKKEVRFVNESFLSQFIQNALQKSFLRTEYTPKLTTFSSPSVLPWELKEQVEEIPVSLNLTPSSLQMELPCTLPSFAVIGLFAKYLVVDAVSLPQHAPLFQNKERTGVVFVDLSLAVSRIAFEEIIRKKNNEKGRQRLLVPKKLQWTKPEVARLQKKQDELRGIGIEIQVLGERDFIIEGMPICWEIEDIEEALYASLEEVEKETIEQEFCKRFAMRMSSFVRWNKEKSSIQEAEATLAKLLHCEDPYFSPRGKPIMAIVTERDIEQLF